MTKQKKLWSKLTIFKLSKKFQVDSSNKMALVTNGLKPEVKIYICISRVEQDLRDLDVVGTTAENKYLL